LVKLLKGLIASQLPGRPSHVFGRLLDMLVAHLADILSASDEGSFDYLSPMVATSCANDELLTIATLNYDLGVELVAERQGIECSTGVTHWAETGLLDFASAPLRLLKLHGSLDWRRHPYRSLLAQRLSLTSDDGTSGQPFLVFGQREKLRAEGPFLQLLEEFRTVLHATETLGVLGYAFRDGHINECIARWLTGDAGRRVLVVDPFFPDPVGWGNEDDFQRDLLRWGARTGSDGQEQVRLCIRREPASQFLADLHSLGSTALLKAAFAPPETPLGAD